jgi:asparagine synthase (glutamine-hydrolysing)
MVTNKLTMIDSTKYVGFPSMNPSLTLSEACNLIRKTLIDSVNVRVDNTERPIACLLSGGLDSSLITALVNKRRLEMGVQSPLETYSIGLEGAEDMKYATMVADYLKTNHTNVVVTENEFFDAIPEVIYNIESYDTTTVRASVGNYLVAKYISKHSKAKVIFNGDGSDEVTGGYLYMKNAPTNIEFDNECKRLVNDIHCFDVLRSDKSISSNGLEPRAPFLDRAFVEAYFTIPVGFRNQPGIEKRLLREAFSKMDLLPSDVLWRKKEAFSDGVSSVNRSWFQIIKEKIPPHVVNIMNANAYILVHNPPTTPEQYYYRMLFDKHYESFDKTIPYFWMPKYTNATDCSARLLYV